MKNNTTHSAPFTITIRDNCDNMTRQLCMNGTPMLEMSHLDIASRRFYTTIHPMWKEPAHLPFGSFTTETTLLTND